jgi:hypothetical protein
MSWHTPYLIERDDANLAAKNDVALEVTSRGGHDHTNEQILSTGHATWV